ncbi:MAG: hypothetical protein LBJ02_02175 [Bifidobacteriaceae bacterium]|jgi:hypothetical protein|nr:hypothetical protein [Bifidobacteriaceae bacterium]
MNKDTEKPPNGRKVRRILSYLGLPVLLIGAGVVLMLVLVNRPQSEPVTAPESEQRETSLEDLAKQAKREGYWAADLMRDGEVTWADLEWAHDQWRQCMEDAVPGLITLDPDVSPIDGSFAGYEMDWEGDGPESIPEGLSGEQARACDKYSDHTYLDQAYLAAHEPVMAQPLREYVIECLAEVGTGVKPDSTNAAKIAQDLGLPPTAPIVGGCVNAGIRELYPDLGTRVAY